MRGDVPKADIGTWSTFYTDSEEGRGLNLFFSGQPCSLLNWILSEKQYGIFDFNAMSFHFNLVHWVRHSASGLGNLLQGFMSTWRLNIFLEFHGGKRLQ